MRKDDDKGTYSICFLVEHEGGYGPTGIGAVAGLTADMNSGAANAEMVDGAGDSARRRRHYTAVM